MAAVVQVITSPATLNEVSTFLSGPPHAHNITSMELAYVPTMPGGELEEAGEGNAEDEEKIERLLEMLEGEPDCIKVWTT